MLEVNGQRKRGRPRQTRKRQVEEKENGVEDEGCCKSDGMESDR